MVFKEELAKQLDTAYASFRVAVFDLDDAAFARSCMDGGWGVREAGVGGLRVGWGGVGWEGKGKIRRDRQFAEGQAGRSHREAERGRLRRMIRGAKQPRNGAQAGLVSVIGWQQLRQ